MLAKHVNFEFDSMDFADNSDLDAFRNCVDVFERFPDDADWQWRASCGWMSVILNTARDVASEGPRCYIGVPS